MSTSLYFDLTLDQAIGYVGLPRNICTLHELPITATIGPHGPYRLWAETTDWCRFDALAAQDKRRYEDEKKNNKADQSSEGDNNNKN
jgi:hypothetical protein